MDKMFPCVNLPVTPARRWGNPQTAHLLDPDWAFDTGSRACLHGSLVSALCWVLTKGTRWHYSHIFPEIFLTFSSFQTSFPQGNSPGHPTLSFHLQVSVDTSFTATFEGFLAPTAMPFLPSISPSFSGICHLCLSGSFSNPSFSPCLPRRCTLVPAAYCLQLLSPLGTHLRPKYSPALSPCSTSGGATRRALIFQHISYELAFNYY